jgi:GDP-fucose transporter C1
VIWRKVIIIPFSDVISAVVCCAVIIFGFWLGVDQELVVAEGETPLTLYGIFFGVTSSFFVAANAIFTKKVGPFLGHQLSTF